MGPIPYVPVTKTHVGVARQSSRHNVPSPGVWVSYIFQPESDLARVVSHGVLSVNDQVDGPPDLLIRTHVDLESCANSWFSFLKGETIASGGRFARYSLNQKVCSWRYDHVELYNKHDELAANLFSTKYILLRNRGFVL